MDRRKEMERQREREKTLYVPPPPPPPPVAEQVGGFTKVRLCSERMPPPRAPDPFDPSIRDCKRAGPVLTCPEFKACYQLNKRGPCGGEEWFKKCRCRDKWCP